MSLTLSLAINHQQGTSLSWVPDNSQLQWGNPPPHPRAGVAWHIFTCQSVGVRGGQTIWGQYVVAKDK